RVRLPSIVGTTCSERVAPSSRSQIIEFSASCASLRCNLEREPMVERACASRFLIVVAAAVAVAIVVCAAEATATTVDGQQSAGTIGGVIADETGAPLATATVTLTSEGKPRSETLTDANGRFSLTNAPMGPFTLTIAAHGFAARVLTGTVAAGDVANLGEIRLRIAVNA